MNLLEVVTAPWAIQPEKLVEIQDIYAKHLKGEKIDIAALEAKHGGPLNNQTVGYEVINGVAVLPVHGVLAKRMNLFTQISGGASTELLARDFQQAIDDPDVESIILDTDSPGGAVDGTVEFAELIYNARGIKPIVTYANGLMASAAYWIGSAADMIFTSGPTTMVGSIGVVTRHMEFSKADEKQGVKTTYIFSGKYKVVGPDNKPLSDDDRDIIQAELDYIYSIFVGSVAQQRGVSVQTVLDDMADGKIFIGQQAIDAGLVDGVSTLDALIELLSSGKLPEPSQAGALSEQEKERLAAVLETNLEENEMAGEIKVTKGYVMEHHADIADAFREEGKASVDVESAKAEAATAERERIQSVFSMSIPGHEKLIDTLAFDGKTTGPEAAVQILKADQAKKGKTADDLNADGEELAKVAATANADANLSEIKPKVDKDAPLEDRCKAAWDADKDLRAEFGNDYGAYLAFATAQENGQVKMLKQA